MIELLSQFIGDAGRALVSALSVLFWPAVFFLCLAMLTKRRGVFDAFAAVARESRTTLLLISINAVAIVPVIAICVVAIRSNFEATQLVRITAEFWSEMPAPLVILAAIIAGDFIGYWRHRLEHSRFLWPAHAVHHSDTAMTWLTLERFHPINRASTALIDLSLLAACGFPPYALIANSMVRHYYGFFIHADLPWTYGKLGHVFVSPAMHRWHHSAEAIAFNSNYATVFSVFDRAFGTFYVPGPCNSALGVQDDMGTGVVGQLTYAFRPSAYRAVPKEADAKKRTAPIEAPPKPVLNEL